MGRYTGFSGNEMKIESAIKAFYEKYGIDIKDKKGHDYDPISSSLYEQDRLLKSWYQNQDPLDKDKHAADLQDHALTTYKKALKFVINKRTENVLKEENVVGSGPKEIDMSFMSDFKSLFDEIFKIVYYPNLTDNLKAQYDVLDNDNKFYVNSNTEQDYIKFKCSQATDIELEHKAENTYTNKGMMQQLRDAIEQYHESDNIMATDEEARQRAQDNLLASYVALKQQYEKRNKFARIFNGIQSRACFAEAEEIMSRLIRNGHIQGIEKDGKYQFLETANANLKPSKYLKNIVEGTKKENLVKNTSAQEAMNKYVIKSEQEKAQRELQDKKDYQNSKSNEYYKIIKAGGEINFMEMDTKKDYPIYEKVCKDFNASLDKTKKQVLHTQIKPLKKLLKDAIKEHYSKDVNKDLMDKALNDAEKEKHRSKLLDKIKEYKEKGIIDPNKYDLNKYEKDPEAIKYDKMKVTIKSLEDVKKIKRGEKVEDKQLLNIKNEDIEKNDLQIHINGNELKDNNLVNENIKINELQ